MNTKQSGKKSKSVKAWGLVWKGHSPDNIVFPLYRTKAMAFKWAKPHMRVVKILITELPLKRAGEL